MTRKIETFHRTCFYIAYNVDKAFDNREQKTLQYKKGVLIRTCFCINCNTAKLFRSHEDKFCFTKNEIQIFAVLIYRNSI